MTITYSPDHPKYFDEADLRQEMKRVFEICHSCRLCFNLCPSFPTLFDHVDRHDGDVEALTESEQDEVVEKCYQCKLCYLKCPYIPPHEWQLDFPRLMLRAQAVKKAQKKEPLKDRLADAVTARTDLGGALGTTFSSLANAVVSKPNTIWRKMGEKTVGIAPTRLLPPYSRQRFSTWWRRRGGPEHKRGEEEVSFFPTCFVEYMQPEIGRDLVEVLEKAGISISVPSPVRCCGAPFLHSGDVKNFKRVAEENVRRLSVDAEQGKTIVVPQPTCGYVLKKDYPIYFPGRAAEAVAKATKDAGEYLVELMKASAIPKPDGAEEQEVIYHLPCHMRAQNIGAKSAELLRAAGYRVRIIDKCSGIDGTWGYKSAHEELSREVGKPLMEAISSSSAPFVASDCHLAATAIWEGTGKRPMHPVQLLKKRLGGKDAEAAS